MTLFSSYILKFTLPNIYTTNLKVRNSKLYECQQAYPADCVLQCWEPGACWLLQPCFGQPSSLGLKVPDLGCRVSVNKLWMNDKCHVAAGCQSINCEWMTNAMKDIKVCFCKKVPELWDSILWKINATGHLEAYVRLYPKKDLSISAPCLC
jgi:hypothetical protein